MTPYPRYAIYYTSEPDSALTEFGASLLGYDAHTGEDLRFPDGVPPDWAELTQDPRRYGFHATLKAPFSLASGCMEAELLAACAKFSAKPRLLPVIQPVVGSIGGFIAVIPTWTSVELIQFAAECVREFDSFRAPLTEADRARRNPARLTPAQEDNLDRWGYPYVMEEFRFHMTLTARIDVERREALLKSLGDRFSSLGLATLAIDQLAIFRQESPASRFRVAGYWKL